MNTFSKRTTAYLGRWTKRIVYLLLAVSLSACVSVTVGDHFRDRALERVSFDTNCPKEQIDIVGLNRKLDESMAAGVQVGVQGCGKRAVYVFTNETGWVLNSDAQEVSNP